MVLKLGRKQITKRLLSISKKLEKLDKNVDEDKISIDKYLNERKRIITKLQFPLQRAALVLGNPQIYGYNKETISISQANTFVKKFGTGGKKMTPRELAIHYGWKIPKEKKKK